MKKTLVMGMIILFALGMFSQGHAYHPTEFTVSFTPNGNSNFQSVHSTIIRVIEQTSDGYVLPEPVFQGRYMWTKSSSWPTSGTWTSFTSSPVTVSSPTQAGDWYLHVEVNPGKVNYTNRTSLVFKVRRWNAEVSGVGNWRQIYSNNCSASNALQAIKGIGNVYNAIPGSTRTAKEDYLWKTPTPKGMGEYTHVWRIRDLLNYWIKASGHSSSNQYRYTQKNNYDLETFYASIENSLSRGYPVIIAMSGSLAYHLSYYGVPVSGHYITISKIQTTSNGVFITLHDTHRNTKYQGIWIEPGVNVWNCMSETRYIIHGAK